ncbi:four-carbon acid sugar kinase family protein [Arthrobacter sp. H14]|uniref:four-carbon acid sugar kinase family protein n=1 Tax=Arthrobacter sp. H14 TaxID=1312959 RepID=UPI0004BBFA65|nr:four-carbon acid sugar kinase family protein [Arthrobacter sp. H14]
MLPAVRVGIVADALTGANDSVVQFAQRGWSSHLVIGTVDSAVTSDAVTSTAVDDAGPDTAVAVVTDARAMNYEAARKATAVAVHQLAGSGLHHLYLKIDSTMRGSVHAQIRGALDSWTQSYPDAFAVVCPAYPAMGRTVEQGRILIEGRGVETTAAGRDLLTPVHTNEMQQLLPGSVRIALNTGSDAANADALERAAQSAEIVVVDASSDADLEDLARTIELVGPRVVPVGAAGLAGSMARVWARHSIEGSAEEAGLRVPAAGAVLVVASSLHEVSRVQAETLAEAFAPTDVQVLTPALEDLIDEGGVESWLDARHQDRAAGTIPRVVMLLAPAERTVGGLPPPDAGATVAAGLAVIAEYLLESGDFNSLVLIGGDGAHAVLNRLRAVSLLVTGAMQEGIPVGVIERGTAQGLAVVTKAGGFGQPASVLEVVTKLLKSPTTEAFP